MSDDTQRPSCFPRTMRAFDGDTTRDRAIQRLKDSMCPGRWIYGHDWCGCCELPGTNLPAVYKKKETNLCVGQRASDCSVGLSVALLIEAATHWPQPEFSSINRVQFSQNRRLRHMLGSTINQPSHWTRTVMSVMFYSVAVGCIHRFRQRDISMSKRR